MILTVVVVAVVCLFGGFALGAEVTIRRVKASGPLALLSRKAIRIERASGALRGRFHAVGIAMKRADKLQSVEIACLATEIAMSRSPIEDVEEAPDELPPLGHSFNQTDRSF